MKRKPMNLRTMTLIAILSALSAVLMVIYIPLPFAPTFLKFDIAEFPGPFAGFFIGPSVGVIVILLKNINKLSVTSVITWWIYKRIGNHLRSLTQSPNEKN
ncbi:MAG: ECF transporter S component [Clostridiales bacterium]|nr:ECF transporter S component [Clostridiales bacterium]